MQNKKLRLFNLKTASLRDTLRPAPKPRAPREAALLTVSSGINKAGKRNLYLSLHPRLVAQAGLNRGDIVDLTFMGDHEVVLAKANKGWTLGGAQSAHRLCFRVTVPDCFCPNFSGAATQIETQTNPPAIAFLLPEVQI